MQLPVLSRRRHRTAAVTGEPMTTRLMYSRAASSGGGASLRMMTSIPTLRPMRFDSVVSSSTLFFMNERLGCVAERMITTFS